MAALLVGMVSYYSSYLMVVLASLGLLWLRGMVGVSLAATSLSALRQAPDEAEGIHAVDHAGRFSPLLKRK